MIPYKQLSLADIFTDCQNKFDNDKFEFLSILDETINLDEIVPVSFVSHFHAATDRPRRHKLYPMLKALLLQLIFSIPTTSLLIVFLKYSQELRDFWGFDVVPDASKFTRFKQDFLLDLQSMFDHPVDLTEPICQRIDKHKASMLLFDTSGIEAWVTENNPKYANRIIRQLKAFKKANGLDDSYDFMVGSPQRKWDLLPSRFIGREGSFGQQGILFSFNGINIKHPAAGGFCTRGFTMGDPLRLLLRVSLSYTHFILGHTNPR